MLKVAFVGTGGPKGLHYTCPRTLDTLKLDLDVIGAVVLIGRSIQVIVI